MEADSGHLSFFVMSLFWGGGGGDLRGKYLSGFAAWAEACQAFEIVIKIKN